MFKKLIIDAETNRMEKILKQMQELQKMEKDCITPEEKKWFNDSMVKLANESVSSQEYYEDAGFNDGRKLWT